MPKAYPSVYTCLSDGADDVSAVAAAALVPVVSQQSIPLTTEQLSAVVNTAWQSLLELDELTSATQSILNLLSTLLIHPEMKRNK